MLLFFIYINKTENIEMLQKMAFERYQNLFEKEKEQKRCYRCQRYKNLPENEKGKLVEFRKNKCKRLKGLS